MEYHNIGILAATIPLKDHNFSELNHPQPNQMAAHFNLPRGEFWRQTSDEEGSVGAEDLARVQDEHNNESLEENTKKVISKSIAVKSLIKLPFNKSSFGTNDEFTHKKFVKDLGVQ